MFPNVFKLTTSVFGILSIENWNHPYPVKEFLSENTVKRILKIASYKVHELNFRLKAALRIMGTIPGE